MPNKIIRILKKTYFETEWPAEDRLTRYSNDTVTCHLTETYDFSKADNRRDIMRVLIQQAYESTHDEKVFQAIRSEILAATHKIAEKYKINL